MILENQLAKPEKYQICLLLIFGYLLPEGFVVMTDQDSAVDEVEADCSMSFGQVMEKKVSGVAVGCCRFDCGDIV